MKYIHIVTTSFFLVHVVFVSVNSQGLCEQNEPDCESKGHPRHRAGGPCFLKYIHAGLAVLGSLHLGEMSWDESERLENKKGKPLNIKGPPPV